MDYRTISSHFLTLALFVGVFGCASQTQKSFPEAIPGSKEAQLIAAAGDGRSDTVRALLAAGAHVDATWEGSGRTALIQAAQSGHSEVVRLLLAAGADVNHVTIRGESPLYEASRLGHVESVRLLLQAGANVNKRDYEDGFDALMNASMRKHSQVVLELLKAGADATYSRAGWTALIYAASEGDIESVRALIDAGADVNAKDRTSFNAKDKTFGKSVLMHAEEGRHTEVVRLLREKGARY
jgi:ankyrin repeat protein